MLAVLSTVASWRAKTEPAKDTASVACLKSTRASEDAGWRRFAAARSDRAWGGEHSQSATRRHHTCAPVPDPDEFRRAMGLVPTAVTVITAPGADGPSGATANAVVSLSLEPPLMLAALDRRSRTLAALRRAGVFGVSVLAAGQDDLALR